MDLREQIEERRLARRRIEEMLECEGWKEVSRVFQAARVSRRNHLLAGEESGMDGLIELAKQKSELAGMEFMYNLPQMLIDELRMEEMQLTEEMQEDEQTP